jgi:hypothetical protein
VQLQPVTDWNASLGRHRRASTLLGNAVATLGGSMSADLDGMIVGNAWQQTTVRIM